MPELAPDTGGRHHERIRVIDDEAVHRWAARLGVTPDDVRAAVKAAGDLVVDVQEYLHSHHASNGSDH
ncbi:DUF3606 domain-containing protein [Piscinibacter gummiphilus]|uniref:Uncharacterized protein n=1 Tax=Piscinibacter gummiphilus TaxID=946333 RepID=A0A1W6LB26_9BURK|nr:DUF3606 domain-containing protein [Piscinibacter gummiphilus]ARN21368.1 hypothetical protein A4W93_16500 [Piscinibacter gummiphilus]GLS96285.1 hypothetical protein GCM10007918_35770 [Piscinibacter gummiphilus]